MSKSFLKTAAFLIAAVLFFVLDRFLKFLALEGFFDPPIFLFGDIFKFNFASNYGIAFSLPLGGPILTIAISLTVLALLYFLIYLVKQSRKTEALILFALFLGAVSNLADRLSLGYVVDYLDLKYFTVFNLADAMIVVSFLGLAGLYFFRKS